jgi:hypothetical protein
MNHVNGSDLAINAENAGIIMILGTIPDERLHTGNFRIF